MLDVRIDLFPTDSKLARRLGEMFQADYDLLIGKLTEVHDQLSKSQQTRVAKWDGDFSNYRNKLSYGSRDPWPDPLPFLKWATRVLPGAFSRTLTGKAQGDLLAREEARRQAARVVTQRVPWVDDYRPTGIALHGTRAYEIVRLDGICVPEASSNIDTGVEYPPSWEYRGEFPPMSVVNRWGGIEMDYGWIGLWRSYLWDWWRGLSTPARQTVANVCGWDHVPSAAQRPRHVSNAVADFLGDQLALFWTTESESTAQEYGTAVLEIDTEQINAFGAFGDDIVGGGGTVWVLPTWCPQVPITAIRDHGTGQPLGDCWRMSLM